MATMLDPAAAAFTWRVPAGGFRLTTGRELHVRADENHLEGLPGWLLVVNRPDGERRSYSPAGEFPALFRQLADLPHGDREAALGFANRYGSLGFVRIFSCDSPGEQGTRYVEGELGWHWEYDANVLRLAVRTWDLLSARDVGGLAD